MINVFNWLSLICWFTLQCTVVISLLLNPQNFSSKDITKQVLALRIVQSLQCLQIVFVVLGYISGSLIPCLLQLSGRMLVCHYFITANTSPYLFVSVTIIWCFAQINRYLFYLFRNKSITGHLRYNSFIILYPLGVYCEMLIINSFIKNHIETITYEQIWACRIIQFLICVGLIIIYKYMFQRRKQYYSKQQIKPSFQNNTTRTSKSPKAKRS